jgi:hypothetical protein
MSFEKSSGHIGGRFSPVASAAAKPRSKVRQDLGTRRGDEMAGAGISAP